MKTVSSIARILLGIVFTVFGLNGFLHFIPMGPPPTGLAGQYIGALAMSHYLTAVFAFQLAAGILLLANRYVPLALTTLAGILVNILLFHILMEPAGLTLAVVVAILWVGAAWNVRSVFAGLLQSRVPLHDAGASAARTGAWATAKQ